MKSFARPIAALSLMAAASPFVSACSSSDETSGEEALEGADVADVAERLSSMAPVLVHLVPAQGVSGKTRVNFALPLPQGALTDASCLRVLSGGEELPIARRVLAIYADGSARSVQLQVDVEVQGPADLQVEMGAAGKTRQTSDLELLPVEDTLVKKDGTLGPRVWAILPADVLAQSGVVGPTLTAEELSGTPYEAWSELCDDDTKGIEAFLARKSEYNVWLYDRGTVFYRGYARRGELSPLRTAYRETALYRSLLKGHGQSTRNGVPGRTDDAKYSYTQAMAIHYLLTGDDRFRESAEDMAEAMASLWPEGPGYHGEEDGLWTERHAGFTLLAYTWASIVSDDQAAHFRALADSAVDAYLDVQDHYPASYKDPDARCFSVFAGAHKEGSADEDYGYYGCSPWMSAILADGLDVYATERGGEQAEKARRSIVKLGKMLAKNGRDKNGKPVYWMGVGTSQKVPDPGDEHWGESAYVIAMAHHYDPGHDPALATAVSQLVGKFSQHGKAPHLRSFNWQCRSAPATGWYMER